MKISRRPSFAFLAALSFTLLAGWVLAHHELWRDEMQAWLIARDSPSLTVLLQNMRYEGTPPLWHFLLHAISHLTTDPRAMQALNLLLGGLFVYLFCRHAPFSKLQKLLLCFGYYLFYQYTIVSRQYLLSLLCLLVACILFPNRRRQPLLWGAALGLAAWTSVHALIIAAGILLADRIVVQPTNEQPDDFSRSAMASVIVFLLMALVAVYWMYPARDNLFPPSRAWRFHWDLNRLLEVVSVIPFAFLPTPVPTIHFWEMPWIGRLPCYTLVAFPLSALLLGACAFTLRTTPRALLLYGLGNLGLIAFFYCKYIGHSRHYGFLFFLFVFALWLSRDESGGIHRFANRLLTGLLVFHLAGAVIAAFWEIRAPFSNSKAVADYMRSEGLQQTFIAVAGDSAGAPLAGYLNRALYYPQGDRWGSFTRWDFRRIEILPPTEIVDRTRRAAAGNPRPLLLILDNPLPEAEHRLARAAIRWRASFTGSIIGDENYHVYEIRD